MIATIGLMFGAYVIVQMMALIMPPNPKPQPAVAIAAMIAIFLTVIGMLDILTGALKIETLLKMPTP